MDPKRLPFALEGTLRGEAAPPRTLVARLVASFHPAFRRQPLGVLERPSPPLTRRERQVLQPLDEGLGTSEVAERLVVESVTVRTHVASLMRKLDVDDRAGVLKLLRERRAAVAGR